MFCTECGKENHDGASFCSSCGSKQSSQENSQNASSSNGTPTHPSHSERRRYTGIVIAIFAIPAAVIGLFFLGFNLDSLTTGGGGSTPSPTATNVTNSTNLSSYDCDAIRNTISRIEQTIEYETLAPASVAYRFEGAASDFELVAKRTSGERADWLRQMIENSYFVSTYIEFGAPSDGPQRLDRLVASFDRVSRYCD